MRRLLLCSALVGAAFLSSCVTRKKVDRWNAEHPQQEAANCAGKYPCRPGEPVVKDSIVYADNSQQLALIDSLAALADSLLIRRRSDSMQALISHKDCLDVVEGQDKEVRRLASEVAKLKNRPCRPDTLIREKLIPYVDSAANVANRLRAMAAEKRGTELERRLVKAEGMASSRLWMFIAACAVLLLLLVLLFRKR